MGGRWRKGVKRRERGGLWRGRKVRVCGSGGEGMGWRDLMEVKGEEEEIEEGID